MCTVPGCSSIPSLKNVSFHRFPIDPKLKQLWIKNIKKGDDWTPSKFTRICSLHFEDSCYREGLVRKTLHSYAVPTMFYNHPSSCRPKLPKKRRYVAKYESSMENNEPQFVTPLPKVPTRNRTTQTEYVDTSADTELRKVLKLVQRLKAVSARRESKLKGIRRQNARLKKKNTDLEIIINALYDKMESENIEVHRYVIDDKDEVESTTSLTDKKDNQVELITLTDENDGQVGSITLTDDKDNQVESIVPKDEIDDQVESITLKDNQMESITPFQIAWCGPSIASVR